MNPRELLLNSFQAALAAADPLQIVPAHLPSPPKGRTLVVGAGKAAAAMAQAVEMHWPLDAPLEGRVITRYGHSVPTRKIEVVEAGHPLPDQHGELATRAILEKVQALTADDLLLGLFSGGGSSLLSMPIAGMSMEELKTITHQLLLCGASIQEINTVRKHLSAVLGGRLAAACHAPIHCLIISDVTGDNPTHVASGPCAPDPTTYADTLALIKQYAINVAPSVMTILQKRSEHDEDETPKPGNAAFRNVKNRVIATAHQSLAAAAQFFRAHHITPLILGDTVTGEAREVAKVYAALAREIRYYNAPFKPPVALISGGETTVTVKGRGRGGRNTEFLLSLAIALNGLEDVYALACDTDGIDGTEQNAGAILTPDSLARAQPLSLDPTALLNDNDAYAFFERLDDLIITGPTRTNVNDYRVILVW
ncbi:glycerate kinase [Nitrosomonas sp. Nm58]|uniref:glycerate kinase type-2 family protein n=1 Tax=Nitrosomonas sp. Nm58 TaxID=200126 RepID=UPI00089ADE93|nr:glycerate kinase [Nitrosomonas sp. Nm58]SDY00149.1 hydroxypyruvate reductase [Nitrosomonas sp. Nm58]